MANTFFQCKQFIVHQEHTAMKVCTDACLFGAWLSNERDVLHAKSILDIGTGTGLLSLMLAQVTKDNTHITAVEIEPSAAAEAKKNSELSPWANRISIVQNSIQAFSKLIHEQAKMDKFDCIVTNPPFFEVDLQSPSNEKNLASHSVALPWEELLKEVANLLLDKGTYYVLIPALRAYTMQKLAAQNGLSLAAEVVVMNAPQQKPFRVMQKFVKTNAPIQEINRSQFYIKKEDQSYSKAFIQLLAPYYLHL